MGTDKVSRRGIRALASLVASLAVLLLARVAVTAGQVELAWDPVAEADG